MQDNMKEESNTKATYIFDLDGTLCTHEKDYSKAKPLQKRIDFVNKLYDDGFGIIIDTARGSITKEDHLELTRKQLKEWGVKYHQVRVGVKFFGTHYVDDKGLSDKQFFKDG